MTSMTQSALLREGDERAWESVVTEYTPRLVNYARRKIGSPAEDIVQEMFLKIYNARRNIVSENILPLLYTSTRRLCIDYMKQYDRNPIKSRLEQIAEDSGGIFDNLIPDRRVNGSILEQEELRERVQAAIRKLPKKLQQVVQLRDIAGLQYNEIAEALEIPIGSVKSRLYGAYKRLRPLLEKDLKDAA